MGDDIQNVSPKAVFLKLSPPKSKLKDMHLSEDSASGHAPYPKRRQTVYFYKFQV